jgi:TonB family protein
MDRFSLYAIYIALLALAEDPALWAAYDGGDERLLFKRDDYADPENSRLFADLAKREALAEWIDRFAAVCHGTYAEIPAPADFLAGRFDYARFVPGGPRPAPRPVAPPVLAAPAPEPAPAPAPAPPTAPFAPVNALRRFAWMPREIDFVTPAIVVVLLALGGIFHNAIFRFAFPPPPPPAQTDAPAPPPPEHRARPPVARAPHAASPAKAAPRPRPDVPRAQTDAQPTPAETAQPVVAAPPPERHPAAPARAAGPVHAAAPAHVAAAAHAGAPQTKLAHRHTDATTALLDAAAGDVPAAPRCATPDAPARVLSVAVPAAAKLAGGGAADVAVSLGASGEVTGASIAGSSGSADLDAAALDAARRSSYSAQIVNCSHVASSLTLHVRL